MSDCRDVISFDMAIGTDGHDFPSHGLTDGQDCPSYGLRYCFDMSLLRPPAAVR